MNLLKPKVGLNILPMSRPSHDCSFQLLNPPHFSTQNHNMCHATIGFGPNNFQKKCNSSNLDEEDQFIIILRICKSRSMSRNQVQKLNLHSNAHNSTNTTWNQTIRKPPKEVKFQEFFNNM